MILDIILLIVGIILGLVLGIGIYWLPLGQFMNEWKAIFNLNRHRFSRGSKIVIRTGTELVRVGIATYPNPLGQDKETSIWHDEGVGWFHTAKEWQRVRVLQVYDPKEKHEIPPVYRICHLDVVK